MIRIALCVVLGILLEPNTSLATWAPGVADEVPKDHWARDAVEAVVRLDLPEVVAPEHWSFAAVELVAAELGVVDFVEEFTGATERRSEFQFRGVIAALEELWAIRAESGTDLDREAHILLRALAFRYPPQGSQPVEKITDSYTIVPVEHWSYAAFDYMATTEVLLGYPPGFFSGSSQLTRYEMAQAVVRLLEDTANLKDALSGKKLIAEALREEYSDQLSSYPFAFW